MIISKIIGPKESFVVLRKKKVSWNYTFLHNIQIQIQNISIKHSAGVYTENQEYETQMGIFNSTIIKHHIVLFYLFFALEKINWVSRRRKKVGPILNTWVKWIGQRQLQDKMRNI